MTTTITAVGAHPALHRYFLQAMVSRRGFLAELEEGHGLEPAAMVYLLMWYGCLYVVVEGWRAERINWPPVTDVLRDTAKLNRLRECRNAVFHYSATYLDPRVETLMRDRGFVAWVHQLYDEISAFFLDEKPAEAL